MNTWIRISCKNYKTFDQADLARRAIRLAFPEENRKVRVRRRNAASFDVIAWERSTEGK